MLNLGECPEGEGGYSTILVTDIFFSGIIDAVRFVEVDHQRIERRVTAHASNLLGRDVVSDGRRNSRVPQAVRRLVLAIDPGQRHTLLHDHAQRPTTQAASCFDETMK